MAYQRLASPVHADEREQPMLDPVQFAGSGRQVGHRDLEAGLVGKALEFSLPQLDLRPVAATTVRGDRQVCRLGVALFAEHVPPARMLATAKAPVSALMPT